MLCRALLRRREWPRFFRAPPHPASCPLVSQHLEAHSSASRTPNLSPFGFRLAGGAAAALEVLGWGWRVEEGVGEGRAGACEWGEERSAHRRFLCYLVWAVYYNGPAARNATILQLAVEYESNALFVKVDTDDEYEFARAGSGTTNIVFYQPRSKQGCNSN
ncbi:uncharacterized protein LOC103722352 isoform X1 [Phoenix dactylifera]|uniref:Uncharacterized protein LOC103722352 isoform X1 n=1 Tax=Phoenix dactylifera TaxID=42345 RepID=A0A8B9A4C9_PHODC|nr:uncharacterized protein LOC103722352 isoform X1 [Phoenix dactylifera]